MENWAAVDHGPWRARDKRKVMVPFTHMEILVSAQQMSYARQQELIRHARVFDQYQYEKAVQSLKRSQVVEDDSFILVDSEPCSPTGLLSPESSAVLSPPPRRSMAHIKPLLLTVAESVSASAPPTGTPTPDIDFSTFQLPWEVSTPTVASAADLRGRLSQAEPGLEELAAPELHQRLSAPLLHSHGLPGSYSRQVLGTAERQHRERFSNPAYRRRLGRPGAFVEAPAGYHASIKQVQQHCRLRAIHWQRPSDPNSSTLTPTFSAPAYDYQRTSAPSIAASSNLRLTAQEVRPSQRIQGLQLLPTQSEDHLASQASSTTSQHLPPSPSTSHPFGEPRKTAELLPSLRSKVHAVRAWLM